MSHLEFPLKKQADIRISTLPTWSLKSPHPLRALHCSTHSYLVVIWVALWIFTLCMRDLLFRKDSRWLRHIFKAHFLCSSLIYRTLLCNFLPLAANWTPIFVSLTQRVPKTLFHFLFLHVMSGNFLQEDDQGDCGSPRVCVPSPRDHSPVLPIA